MNKPDKNRIQQTNFDPKEGQRRFLSGDNCCSRCPSLDLNEKSLDSLRKAGRILSNVHNRLKTQGITVPNINHD